MDWRVCAPEPMRAHRPIYSITCCIYTIIMLMMANLPFLSTSISLIIVFLFACFFFASSFILVLKRFTNSICCRHAFLFVQSDGLWFLMTIFVLSPRFIIEMWGQKTTAREHFLVSLLRLLLLLHWGKNSASHKLTTTHNCLYNYVIDWMSTFIFVYGIFARAKISSVLSNFTLGFTANFSASHEIAFESISQQPTDNQHLLHGKIGIWLTVPLWAFISSLNSVREEKTQSLVQRDVRNKMRWKERTKLFHWNYDCDVCYVSSHYCGNMELLSCWDSRRFLFDGFV